MIFNLHNSHIAVLTVLSSVIQIKKKLPSFPAEEKSVSDFTSEDKEIVYSPVTLAFAYDIQVILFEVDCAISYTDLHELFCHFIS